MNASIGYFSEQNVATAYLWVLEDNRLARRFYERQGWQADDVTKDDTIGDALLTERRYSITTF